jgi:hypothetical protein
MGKENQNYDELQGLSGGKKQMWLRQHRDTILEYYEKEGAEATRERFHLKQYTLDSLLKDKRKPFAPELTRYDRLELKVNMAQAALEDLKAEVQQLKEAFSLFQESVGEQIKRNFFMPLLQAGIRLDPRLELRPAPDPLNIDYLIRQAKQSKTSVDEGSEPYDVVSEAEAIASVSSLGSEHAFTKQLESGEAKLIGAYIEACDKEDWHTALAIYQHIAELRLIREEDEGDELIESARDWLAKAEEPSKLRICY